MEISSVAKISPAPRAHDSQPSSSLTSPRCWNARSPRSPFRSGTAGLHPRERPGGVLAQHPVAVLEVRLDGAALGLSADVSGGDERVAAQPAAVVARHVEPAVAAAKLAGVRAQPVDERHVRL